MRVRDLGGLAPQISAKRESLTAGLRSDGNAWEHCTLSFLRLGNAVPFPQGAKWERAFFYQGLDKIKCEVANSFNIVASVQVLFQGVV